MATGLGAAIAAFGGRGGQRRLAAALGISEAAVSQWRDIPLQRVPQLQALTGLTPEVLRPEYFGRIAGARASEPETKRPPRRKAA